MKKTRTGRSGRNPAARPVRRGSRRSAPVVLSVRSLDAMRHQVGDHDCAVLDRLIVAARELTDALVIRRARGRSDRMPTMRRIKELALEHALPSAEYIAKVLLCSAGDREARRARRAR